MKTSTDTAKDKQTVEVATVVSPEVKVAATQAILAEEDPEVTEVLRDRRDETFALVKRLLASAGINAAFSMPNEDEEGEGVDVELSEETGELSPEILDACLRGMEQDFKRGIVVIDEDGDVNSFNERLGKDRSAGTAWETVKERLLANDSKLLKKAATMQGKGELIGVFGNGELCIIDRSDKNGNREPVITAFDAQNNRITITSDTPDRAGVMKNVAKNGRFANYWEIRAAVGEDGFMLPPDSPECEKKGIVAAAEAVSGKPFIRSKNGSKGRSAIFECGDESSPARVRVRVVTIYRATKRTYVRSGNPNSRHSSRGAVRVLRG